MKLSLNIWQIFLDLPEIIKAEGWSKVSLINRQFAL